MRFSKTLMLIDRIWEVIPRRAPVLKDIRQCRIIAHRGAHMGEAVIENSVSAFDRALFAGAWGIEFDVRWSLDGHPMVFHDKTFLRLFGDPTRLGAISRDTIRDLFPAVPTLEEVVNRYGHRMHMMIELKEATDPKKNERLRRVFAHLSPIRDYHILSLNPLFFDKLSFLPPKCFLPVAQTNTRQVSRLSVERGYAGVAGHYLLVTNRIKRIHDRVGQSVGTGYIDSPNCLWGQIQRNVHWIFSNDAVRVLNVRKDHICKALSKHARLGNGGNENT